MLAGTAPVESFTAGLVESWPAAPAAFEGAEVVQAMVELPYALRQSTLPPALHPTNPPTCVLQAWRCTDGPWGAFAFAQVRIQCRSGLRPRGFVRACVASTEAAADGLRAWGFAPVVGDVEVRRYYDEVTVDAPGLLSLRATGPDPLDAGDVAHSATLNLAETPNGLRLVQLDIALAPTRVERVRPAAAVEGLPLGVPVSASVAVGSLALEPVRYACRPDVLAFEGTETVT